MVDGLRLNVVVSNPEDAEEGQVRTITHNGRWVFSGMIDSLVGDKCTLYSTWPAIRADVIPLQGQLELDWHQARAALDRQTRALTRFAESKLPNQRFRELITNPHLGPAAPEYRHVPHFFDVNLDSEKKVIVAQCLATPDMLLIHGPPGTGKTTLIVELIRQELHANPASKILLVSQTHVAIDNVLERLLVDNAELSVVRIGSGSKNLDSRVAHCSVDERGRKLQKDVEEATQRYLRRRAEKFGVDYEEINMGLRALEVRNLRRDMAARSAELLALRQRIQQMDEALDRESTKTTEDDIEARALSKTLGQDADRLASSVELLGNQLALARDRLRLLGKQGRDLADLEERELSEWCDVLLEDDEGNLRELLNIAEDWRLRFSQSDDFRVVIVATASVVAGTCIGFCREAAAMSTEFDLCIVDEASKATTTELLVPLAQARKAILVGDHHQLPAVIEHALSRQDIQDDYSLSEVQLEAQLFESLQASLAAGHRAELTVQYRMRRAIGDLISRCFYSSKLITSKVVDDRSPLDLTFARLRQPVTWFDTEPAKAGVELEQKRGSSFSNQTEIECILALLRRIALVFREKEPANCSIAVISGYAAQAAELRKEVQKEKALDELDIVCDTVHAFQGREVDICIYSITRHNNEGKVGFLKDWRHLNVALSRARDFLVIVGGYKFCRTAIQPNPFSELVDYVVDHDGCEVRTWTND